MLEPFMHTVFAIPRLSQAPPIGPRVATPPPRMPLTLPDLKFVHNPVDTRFPLAHNSKPCHTPISRHPFFPFQCFDCIICAQQLSTEPNAPEVNVQKYEVP
jgi:hypothetical protein